MKHTNKNSWNLRALLEHANSNHAEIDGKWVPARPINYKYRTLGERIHEAWEVFTGKVETFYWPGNQ